MALLMMALIAPLAGVSAAGLLDLDSDSSASAYTANSAVDDAGSAINTVKKTVNGEAGASVNSTVNAGNRNASGSANANVNANANANSNASGNANVKADLDETFSVDRDSDDVTKNLGSQVKVQAVETQADLRGFAATQIRNDENLSGMAFGPDSVSVSYRERARFFGIIPTSVNVNVVVKGDGTVDIRYPWYSFLMITDRADLEAAIKSEVSAYMTENSNLNRGRLVGNATTTATSTATTTGNMNANANAYANANANSALFNARGKASLAARIQAVLRAHLIGENGNATTTQGTY